MSRMRPQSSAVFISLVAFSAGPRTVTECTSTEKWSSMNAGRYSQFGYMLFTANFILCTLYSFVRSTTEKQISAIPAKSSAHRKDCTLDNWLLWTHLPKMLIYLPLILTFLHSTIIDLMSTNHHLSPLIYLTENVNFFNWQQLKVYRQQQ